MRKTIQAQLDEVNKLASDPANNLTLAQRLEIITALSETVAGQGKALDNVAKHVLSGEDEGESTVTGEDMLKLFTK